MTHYIALIHKDSDSCYGITFPDVPGVTAAADSLDEALEKGAEALAIAAEDWEVHVGAQFPDPRTLDHLRNDPDFIREMEAGSVVAAIPLSSPEPAAA